MSRLLVPRRRLLQGLGASAAFPGLVGCGRGEGDSATPGEPGVIDTLVLCMMENRSFDHVFGSYSLVEGRTEVDGLRPEHQCPDGNGVMHGPALLTEPCTSPDPPHGWGSFDTQYANGAMDGFVLAYQGRGPSAHPDKVMSYQTREMQPISYALADDYALCQRWFASVRGPTWPNRLYFHSGTSNGSSVNDLPGSGNFFDQTTIWDQLDEAGVPWAYYYTDVPTIALFGTIENSYPIEQFYADAEQGRLPPVVMVDPGILFNDDHPPHHPMLGQIFLSSIYRALASSPHWERSLFLYTYDECGGFYDHVKPPKAPDDHRALGFNQLGFRVPAVAVGPYVKEGYLSDVVYDHSSGMRHAQSMFGLEPVTKRNEWAPDLSDLIDFERLEQGRPRAPIELPVIELTEEQIEAECTEAVRRPPGQPEFVDLVDTYWPTANRRKDLHRIGWEQMRQAERLGALRIT